MLIENRDEALKCYSLFSQRPEEKNFKNQDNLTDISPNPSILFSSNFNASTLNNHANNFQDISNIDIFQDLEPKIKVFNNEGIYQEKVNVDKTKLNTFPSIKLKNSKKLSLEKFENTVSLNFIESSENKPGNYHKYLKKVIKTLNGFDNIDFNPHIEIRSIHLPKSEKKFTLVLDLDETLIHSDFDSELKFENSKVLEFTHENETISFNLHLRPGLFEFLSFIKEKFEIVIFTASRKEYADCILNYLDPEHNIFDCRLYRDDCIPIKNKVFIKDLRIFKNRSLRNLIIVDNSYYSFSNQVNNGILITSFYENENDNELLNLKKYLQNIYEFDIDDVRIINEQVFNLEGIKNEILEY